MEIWTAFVFGLLGSLHCAAMCGPLALALPAGGRTGASFLAGRVVYNLGRVLTYTALGGLFGAVGATLALAGGQRWISVAAGVAILLGLLAGSRRSLSGPAFRAVAWLKAGLGALLQRHSLSSNLAFGALNGLLPCGLVYMACAGAGASGSVLRGMGYMLAFGIGTFPMMLGIGLSRRLFHPVARLKPQRLIPYWAAFVGGLLILRGLSLGVPYLSPDLSASHGASDSSCCTPSSLPTGHLHK